MTEIPVRLAKDALALDRCRRECAELAREVLELRECLAAAAQGDLKLAEVYAAGGVLGIRRFEGDWTATLEVQGVASGHVAQVNYVLEELVVLRRLWVDPSCAPHFSLRYVTVGHRCVINNGYHAELPCELFAERYGSPVVHEVIEEGVVLSAVATNTSDELRDFRAVAIGYTAKSVIR